MFFVATAATNGRVNLSPKGYDSFRILGGNRVAYLDLAGSGNETQAHIQINNRITIMFCSFAGPTNILRLYGDAKSVMPGNSEWEKLAANFDLLPGTRQIFDICVESVQTSCGYGVPIMNLEKERSTLVKYHAQSDPEEWVKKYSSRNKSIDGLPVHPPQQFFGGEES